MTKAEKRKQIEALKNLGLTDEEIEDVLKADDEIDHGKKLFELPKELEEGAKKARMAGNCKGYTKPEKKEKPIDESKRTIISLLAETVENITDTGTVEVTNPEREITFTANGKKYKIVLSCPRT
jgi:hypothetical protein